MKYTNNATLGVIIFLILFAIAAFYITKDLRTSSIIKQKNNNDSGYTIEVLPIEPAANIPAPDLNRKVNFSTAGENSKVKIVEISETLKTDAENILLWIDLGSWRKGINDYEGAKEAWEYATAIAPQSSIAFNNLGDLYAYYLKDIPRAEKYFLQAIRNEPSGIYLYFKTAEFYRDVARNTQKARAIVEQGIKANSSSTELQSFLNSL